MTCYLLCSPALYIVEKYATYEEAVARLKDLGRPGWHIWEAKLLEFIE